MKFVFFVILFVSLNTRAQTPIIPFEFEESQLEFDYVASDGSYWYDCKHVKGIETHQWRVYCGDFEFKLHLMMRVYQNDFESTVEFHYWADELARLRETHTQSTWITVDQNAWPKRILGFLGFQQDAAQLRIEVKLKK